MPHLFIVLLKINVVLLLFAGAYYLVLRKLTFYTINRFFLLFGILFSTSYPFIDLTQLLSTHQAIPAFVPGLNQNIVSLTKLNEVSFTWEVITAIFYFGAGVMALRLVVQLVSLYRMHQKSVPGVIEHHAVRVLTEEVSPFSFWQTIYVNPGIHTKDELPHILAHEKVHVSQWHTIDVLLSEISLIFYWFNPGIWLMKKAVRENIEFITDAKLIGKGVDKKAYQYSLLGVGSLNSSVAIVNNFNLSDLKKRIIMMNLKRSSKFNLTRYIFILPLLVFLTLAFTIDKKQVSKNIGPLQAAVKQIIPVNGIGFSKNDTMPVQIRDAKKAIKPLKKPDTAKNLSFVFTTDLDVADTTHQAIASEMKKIIGKVITIKLKTASEGSHSSHNLKDTLKLDPMMMTMIADADQSENVSGKKNMVIKKMLFIKTKQHSNDGETRTSFTDSATGMDIYIDGKKVGKEELKTISPDQISNIQLMKNNSSSVFINTKP